MQTLESPSSQPVLAQPTPSQELIDRSVGACVTAIFGAIWIALGATVAMGPRLAVLAGIAICAAAIVLAAMRLAPRAAEDCTDESVIRERKRRNRQFHLINGWQWISIVALILCLNLVHHPEWITVGIVLIVGLHFLPLARLFRSTSHAVAGGALVLWALVYPLVLDAGASSPWGAVGAGLILWAFSGNQIGFLARRRVPG